MEMETLTVQALIETERFDLRPLRRADIGPIELYGGDARIARMTTNIPHPMPPGMVEAFVKRATANSREEDVWAIDGTKSGAADLMGLEKVRSLLTEMTEASNRIPVPSPVFKDLIRANQTFAALEN